MERAAARPLLLATQTAFDRRLSTINQPTNQLALASSDVLSWFGLFGYGLPRGVNTADFVLDIALGEAPAGEGEGASLQMMLYRRCDAQRLRLSWRCRRSQRSDLASRPPLPSPPHTQPCTQPAGAASPPQGRAAITHAYTAFEAWLAAHPEGFDLAPCGGDEAACAGLMAAAAETVRASAGVGGDEGAHGKGSPAASDASGGHGVNGGRGGGTVGTVRAAVTAAANGPPRKREALQLEAPASDAAGDPVDEYGAAAPGTGGRLMALPPSFPAAYARASAEPSREGVKTLRRRKAPAPAKASREGASYAAQVRVLTSRAIRVRRFESLTGQNLFQLLAVAIITGLLWFRRGVQPSLAAASDIVGLLFFELLFPSFRSLFASLFTFPNEYRMLTKERPSGMYRLSAYYAGRTLADLPIEVIFPSLFVLVVYVLSGKFTNRHPLMLCGCSAALLCTRSAAPPLFDAPCAPRCSHL